jgi:hypothetical protein
MRNCSGMSEPELSHEETRTLIDYARRKFAEERWLMSSALRPVREIVQKLDPKPKPPPLPTTQARVEPSWRIAVPWTSVERSAVADREQRAEPCFHVPLAHSARNPRGFSPPRLCQRDRRRLGETLSRDDEGSLNRTSV